MKKNIIIAASLAAFILSGAAAISSSAYAADYRPLQQSFQSFGPGPGPKDPPHMKKTPPRKDPPHMKKAPQKKDPHMKKNPPRKDPPHMRGEPPRRDPPGKAPNNPPPMPPRR